MRRNRAVASCGQRRSLGRGPGIALWAWAWTSLALLAPAGTGLSEMIPVPNASFERPSTPFVSTLLEDWRKAPKPDWYQEGGGFLWDQLIGVFRNPAVGSADRIENCDGEQAVWLFAVPEVGLSQELGETTAPGSHPSRYEPGRAYELTVGILGGGGGMVEGARLELSLEYRNEAGDTAAVATTVVTNRAGLFGSPKRFLDYQVRTPVVKADDAWAGRPIGLRFVSRVELDRQGGYWDLDHVRLWGAPPAELIVRDPRVADGLFTFILEGASGPTVEVLASTDPGRPLSDWEQVGVAEQIEGRWVFAEPAGAAGGGRFYMARDPGGAQSP